MIKGTDFNTFLYFFNYLITGMNASFVVKQCIVYSQQVYLQPQLDSLVIQSLQSVWYLNITIH